MASRTASEGSAPRAARTFTGWLFRSVAWLSLFTILLLAIAAGNGWRPWKSVAAPLPAQANANKRAALDPLATAARRAARSVVSIQTVGQGNTRNLGAGFVLEGGLIATNFHVVSSATEAQVRFVDNRVFAVAGYAAADPAHDLALLRLTSPPSDLMPLVLAESSPPVAAQLMAIGHPRGVEFAFVEGRLSQRVRTSDLPADSQQFVRKLASAADEMRWLQHTANLAEGNSGGPLIDREGHVAGINTWINRANNINYAIEAGLLRNLMATLSESTQPLADLARTDLQASLIVSRLTAERIEALYAEAESFQWLPANRSQYRVLGELALAMTVSQLPQTSQGDQADQERFSQLQIAATKIENRLREKAGFGAPDQITFVNEQALALVTEPHIGLFFFAEVERVVEGDRGRRGMLLKLVGTDQPLFIALDAQLLQPRAGQVYGIFGANLRNEFVRYGDNPLKLIKAPVIVSRTFLEVMP